MLNHGHGCRGPGEDGNVMRQLSASLVTRRRVPRSLSLYTSAVLALSQYCFSISEASLDRTFLVKKFHGINQLRGLILLERKTRSE